MKKRTRTIVDYVAKDGRAFATKKACEQYEADGCVDLRPLPKYGEHRPLTRETLAWMTHGDGDCFFATDSKYAPESSPSWRTDPPAWATHLIYFGK